MVNNLHNLSDKQRSKLAYSPEVCEFILVAFGMRDLLLNYVRAARTVTEARGRAAIAKIYMTASLEELLGSAYTAPPIVTDENLRSAVSDTEGERMMLASANHHCHPPKRWDPITETCV